MPAAFYPTDFAAHITLGLGKRIERPPVRILFVLLSRFDPEGETLLQYYIRRYGHLISRGVEIWEYDQAVDTAKQMYPYRRKEV